MILCTKECKDRPHHVPLLMWNNQLTISVPTRPAWGHIRPGPSDDDGKMESRLCGEDDLPLGSGVATGGSHLDGDDTTEGAGLVLVGNLDEADVVLATHGTRAGGASGNGEGDGEVHVDVGGTLGDDTGALEHGADVALLGDGARALAGGAVNVLGGLEHGTGGEGTLASGVDDGLDGTAAIGGDDVEGTGDGVADLGQGAARLVHGAGDHSGVDLAGAGGLAEAVGLDVGLAEDGGVDLSDLVLARAGNDGALDGESSAVAASVTGDDCDLAVGGNEGGGCESEDEDLGEHFEGWWVV